MWRFVLFSFLLVCFNQKHSFLQEFAVCRAVKQTVLIWIYYFFIRYVYVTMITAIRNKPTRNGHEVTLLELWSQLVKHNSDKTGFYCLRKCAQSEVRYWAKHSYLQNLLCPVGDAVCQRQHTTASGGTRWLEPNDSHLVIICNHRAWITSWSHQWEFTTGQQKHVIPKRTPTPIFGRIHSKNEVQCIAIIH